MAIQQSDPTTTPELNKVVPRLSMRLVLIAPFVLQVFAAVGLTGYL